MFKNFRNFFLLGVISTALLGLCGCGSSIKVPAEHVGFLAGPVSFVLPDDDVWAVQEIEGFNVYGGSKVQVIKLNTDVANAAEINSEINNQSTSNTFANTILKDLQEGMPSESKVREVKNGVAVVEAVYTTWRADLPPKPNRAYPNAEDDKESALPHYVIALSNGKITYFYVFLDKDVYEKALVDVSKFDGSFTLLATDGSHKPSEAAANKYFEIGTNKLNAVDDDLRKLEIYAFNPYSSDPADSIFGWSGVGVRSIVNKTDKNIQSAKVAFTAFNDEGKWTDFFWWGYFHGPVWYDHCKEPIPSGDAIDGHGNYVKNPKDELSVVKAVVKEVTFDDGSTWENPLYDVWVEKYVAKNQN